MERYERKRIIAPRTKSVETILDDSLTKKVQTKQFSVLLFFFVIQKKRKRKRERSLSFDTWFIEKRCRDGTAFWISKKVILNALFYRACSRSKIGARL